MSATKEQLAAAQLQLREATTKLAAAKATGGSGAGTGAGTGEGGELAQELAAARRGLQAAQEGLAAEKGHSAEYRRLAQLAEADKAEQLRLSAAKQLEVRQMAARLEALEGEVQKRSDALGSYSPAMMNVLETARQVADTDANILILGESGTGKGELSRAIHNWSRRSKKAFITINCPSLSADLMESELFGHNRGAFTGATESTLGRVNQADGGTLFLDEIGDFPLALQPKLLRFIQDKEYERVGDPVTRRADVRILAATNLNLEEMVREGKFREDLLYRLNVITLNLPPMRERPEDVLTLAERFLAFFVKSYGRPARGFSDGAIGALKAYRWPGNVRELRNVVERASIICPQDMIEVSHLGLADQAVSNAPRIGEPLSLEALEKAHISGVLSTSDTLDQAARILGIDASTLYRKRKQYGL